MAYTPTRMAPQHGANTHQCPATRPCLNDSPQKARMQQVSTIVTTFRMCVAYPINLSHETHSTWQTAPSCFRPGYG